MSQLVTSSAVRGRPRQKPSHVGLLQDMSMVPAPSKMARKGHLDAIVVPASRHASSFDGLIDLSILVECPLVLLCSGQADIDRLAERVAKRPSARALLVDVSANGGGELPKLISDGQFDGPNAGRRSDLSLKRNLGLLIARLHGWHKIAFIDDDITVRPDDLSRLAGQLENHQIAGMVCRKFPDNSVLCHARRLAGFPQDNFVTGAVLGVYCGDIPLPFFPDIYNEDWFFFGQAAARHDLPAVGSALQAEYDPFANPTRARHEEFGDLVAEGLFSVIEDTGSGVDFPQLLKTASLQFWRDFQEVRAESIEETDRRLRHLAYEEGDEVARKASRSLAGSRDQLQLITPDDCVDFIEMWQEDLESWGQACAAANNVSSTRAAMDILGIRRWRGARHGNSDDGLYLSLHR